MPEPQVVPDSRYQFFVLLIIVVLVLIGLFGFYVVGGISGGKKQIRGEVGAGFRFGLPKEKYQGYQDSNIYQEVGRGITSTTAHTPEELRVPEGTDFN